MRQFSLLLSLALAPAVACNSDDSSPPVGRSHEALLVTPDAEVVGKATVANSESTLSITVATDEGWTLEKVRVALGTQLSHIPQTLHGEPIPGRFPLRRKLGHDATTTSWRLPLIVEPGTTLYFAVMADVKRKPSRDDGKGCDADTAWGEGMPFPKLKGSMYFTFDVQRAAPPTLAGLYRTHTQDQWGAVTAGDDAAGYLSANFVGAFPTGVTVGMVPGFTARFITAAAVASFLPQTGFLSPLGRNWVNPPAVMNNPLAGNTLALALNVGFDAYDPDFAPGVLPLGELVVADPRSRFFGFTVAEVLSKANEMLSGPSDGTFTLDEVNACVLRINQTFENGTVDLGFVGLP